jgi:AcrR family transcriptional regulator
MPRAGLTPDAVVARAGDLADRDGYDALTLAALAGGLGVRVPSLYKHVGGLGDVQRRVALDGLRGLDAAVRAAAVGLAGRDALLAIGHAYRRYAHAHPGRYAAAQRAPATDDPVTVAGATALTDLVLAVVRGYRLDADEAGRIDETVHAVRAVRSALHGFVTLEAVGGFGMPYDLDVSFDRLLDTLHDGLAHRAPPGSRR